MSMMPRSGNNTKGSSAVTEMETVSLIHQTIIQEAMARTFCASGDMIVIGNALEKDPNLLIEISERVYDWNQAIETK